MNQESKEYLSGYINITKDIENKIDRHAKRYRINPDICAWYRDWEDFCSDWCDPRIGYTRTQAREILHGGIGEFMFLPEGKGIVRFAL